MKTKRGLERTKERLEYLRAYDGDGFDDCLERFRKSVSRNKLTFAEVGTSEKELAEMKERWNQAAPTRMKGQISELVDRLRSTAEEYKLLVIRVVHETRFLDKMLTNLNDTRQRVNDDWLREQRNEVSTVHRELGSKQREYYNTLGRLRDALTKLNLQLSDVGTCEEELASFSKLLTFEHLVKI